MYFVPYVPLPRHPVHHLPAPRRYRPRVRVGAHCVSAHPLRVGAGDYRSTGYPQQK